MSMTETGLALKPWQRKKRPKALWTQIKHPTFQEQARRLSPESGAAGGVKARSAPEAVRMAIYNSIRELFLRCHPLCEAHDAVNGRHGGIYRTESSQVHHRRGRDGWLLVDPRHMLAVCADCHRYIGDNPKISAALGLVDLENWRKES